MYKLLVGDVGPYLSDLAKTQNPQATLVTSHNLNTIDYSKSNLLYTSLADIGQVKDLLDLCMEAQTIDYYPPQQWSDGNHSKQKKWTEYILWYVAQSRPVSGLEISQHDWYFLDNATSSTAKRVSEKNQLWTVGCSITHGVGVLKPYRWKTLVSEMLELPLTDTSMPGSSIGYQSYQLLNSDIRSGDVVFWGLTSPSRFCMVNEINHGLLHVGPDTYKDRPSLAKQVTPDFLTSPSLAYHNIMWVRSAANFCRKAGAKLVILGLMYDWDSVYSLYNLEEFKQYMCWPNSFIDLGSDNGHPGPQQHQLFAHAFVQHYNLLYRT